jgi:hypothetical protein
MRTLRHVLVVCAASVLGLAACRQALDLPALDLPTVDLAPGALPWPTDSGSSGLATAQAAMADSGFLYGENARWPRDIPAEIPPLEGEIRVVKVIPGIQYRIEYSSVSDATLTRYLQDLEASGFDLEYIVYTAPHIPDEQTAEKIARAEWDAVDIARGPYRMRLEFGDEGASLDIDNADFMTPGPPPRISPTPLVWPSDIPQRVPQPASCRLSSIAPLGTYPGGYQIELECTDPLVQERFVEALLAAGLKETDRLVSDTGQIVEVTLQDSEIAVRAGSVVGSHFVFSVWPGTP